MLEVIVSKKNEIKQIALAQNGKLVEIYDENDNYITYGNWSIIK